MPEMKMEDLLPHAPPLVLLDDLVECGDGTITCGLTVRGDGLFDTDGAVPAWIGIEYMAQAVAAYSGVQRQRSGDAVRVGFLLGTRRFVTSVPAFPVGQRLLVRAEKLIEGSNGMASFACTVSGDGVEQAATLSVFEPQQSVARTMLAGGVE